MNYLNKMKQQNDIEPIYEEEVKIDLVEVALHIWSKRQWIIKCCVISLLVALVVAFSIPKEYKSKAIIAPEASENKGGGLPSLAAIAGFNLNQAGTDAIYPEIYPDIVKSTPFITDLFIVPISVPEAKVDTTLYAYMVDYNRIPWWNYILDAPKNLLLWGVSLFKDEDMLEQKTNSNALTPEENSVVENLSERITVQMDKVTGLISLTVKMQDPHIAASLADTVIVKLQNYIVKYRTNKAREDFKFQQDLYERKKSAYEKAQADYTKFVDANNNIILLSYKAEQVRLEQEMNLAYAVYSSVAQQLQIAETKVQEITPVYSIVEPPMVPIYASEPNKILILLIFPFFTLLGCSFWIVLGKNILNAIKSKKKIFVEMNDKGEAFCNV